MAGGQDIAFQAIPGEIQVDIALSSGDYVADNGIENAVLVSLFSNRFVETDELPPNVTDRQGWWADDLYSVQGDRIGSRLWVYDRIGKLNVETRNGMIEACEGALQWMLDEGLAETINVTGVIVQGSRIELSIEIFRPEGDSIPFKFLWDAQGLRRD